VKRKFKTFPLMIAKTFPKGHRREGERTCFYIKILLGEKLHTIRDNYDYWKRRIEQVKAGIAHLSLREWEGKPYRSNQKLLFSLGKYRGVGVQKIVFDDYLYSCLIDGRRHGISDSCIPENDGLSWDDFESWFRNVDDKPKALIHFTPFRY
jgi:hypothetical protein